MIKVFAGKFRSTGFFQKAGFPGDSERIFGIYYSSSDAGEETEVLPDFARSV
jgi:hypothetical protein